MSGLKSLGTNYSVFDTCKYRNGRFYRTDIESAYQMKCNGTDPIVQQLNWIVGKGRKIELANPRLRR